MSLDSLNARPFASPADRSRSHKFRQKGQQPVCLGSPNRPEPPHSSIAEIVQHYAIHRRVRAYLCKTPVQTFASNDSSTAALRLHGIRNCTSVFVGLGPAQFPKPRAAANTFKINFMPKCSHTNGFAEPPPTQNAKQTPSQSALAPVALLIDRRNRM